MPSEDGTWRRELEDAAGTMAQSAPLRIARRCVARLDLSGAGASVAASTGDPVMIFATDERAEFVENLQLTLGVGPCMDAVAHGVAVLVPDVREPVDVDVERWPGFLDAADDAGVRALFALPLRIGAIRVGALDLYRAEPGALGAQALREAFLAADAMAWSLVGADLGQTEGQDLPWPALDGGMRVHQATGMVQAQLDVPTAEALLALRARAFVEGRTVAELASDVVERRLRFGEEGPR